MSTNKHADEEKAGRWVYARFIRKNGKIIYPKKSKYFRFWVND